MEKINFDIKISPKKFKFKSLNDILEKINIEDFHEFRKNWGVKKDFTIQSTKSLLTRFKKNGVPKNNPFPRNYDNMIFTYAKNKFKLDMEDYFAIRNNKQIYQRWVLGDYLFPKDKKYILDEFPESYQFMRDNPKYGYNMYELNGFVWDNQKMIGINVYHTFTKKLSSGHFTDVRRPYRMQLKTISFEKAQEQYFNISLIKREMERITR